MAQDTGFVFMVPVGTQNEANLFGSYMVPIAIITWVLFRTSRERRFTLMYGALATVTYFCVLYSYTRAAWIAAIISFVLVELALRYELHMRSNRLQKIVTVIMCLSIFIILAGFLSVPHKYNKDNWYKPDTIENISGFFGKGTSTFDSSDSSINGRFEIAETAIDKVRAYPLLGPGARAYRDIKVDEMAKGTPAFN